MTRSRADVFTIENGGLQDIQLTIEANGGIKPFVDRIGLGNDLSSGAAGRRQRVFGGDRR